MARLITLFALSLLVGCAAIQKGAEDMVATEEKSSDRALPVRVSATQKGDLRRSLELSGVARAWTQASLAPQAQGTVEAIHVAIGMAVNKGQSLAEIDTTTLSLQADQARRASELAQIQLEDASRELSRAQGLAATGALPPATLEKAQFGERLAQAQVAQAHAAVRVVEAQLQHATLRAPFNGTVTAVAADVGEFWAPVATLQGGPVLIQLEDLSLIRLDVHLADLDLQAVRPGMAVVVRSDALPGKTFEGKVELINASAEAGSRTFLAVLSVPNPDGVIRPGLFLTANIAVETRPQVVTVDPVAVLTGDAGPFVVALDGEATKRVPVKKGLLGDTGLEVEGIAEGLRVVIDGHLGLPDGARVRVID